MSKQVAVFAVALLAVFLVFFFRKKEEKKETKPISAAEIRKPISLGEKRTAKAKKKTRSPIPRRVDPSKALVRDMRTELPEDSEPRPESPPRPPSKPLTIKADVAAATRRKLAGVVEECTRDYKSEEGSKMRIELGLTIGNEEIWIREVSTFLTPEAPASRTDELFRCLEQRAGKLRLAAEGHDDVSEHTLSFPFSL